MSGLMGRGREGKVVGNSAGATKRAVLCNKTSLKRGKKKEEETGTGNSVKGQSCVTQLNLYLSR